VGSPTSGTERTQKLVIVGDSPIAEVAYEYVTHDSAYDVAAFEVERAYLERDSLFGLPIVAVEDAETHFSPKDYAALVPAGSLRLNRVRAHPFAEAKRKGYRLASHISSHAFVWRHVKIRENCFITENNVVQPFVTIGDDVLLWRGNHIGHHSKIGDHVFIPSQIVLSGFTEVGDHCFMGVNATVANNVTIGRDCLIGAGVAILRNVASRGISAAVHTEPRPVTTWKRFDIERPSDMA